MSKINEKKSKLSKGCVVYKLEIAFNKKDKTIEYIYETMDDDAIIGPIDYSWEYLEEYFDEEDIAMMDSLYDVGES
tara:strand:+ start:875 stop:1102 length:228 start_codon:yes stop_codon:yes gene_type:complete